jgi:plasmid stability protein
MECIVAQLSIRGLDEGALAALKQRAAADKASVNAVVLKLLDEALGRSPRGPAAQRHHDLDSLAGRWSAQEAQDFDQATAPFGEVDASMWK